LYQPTLHSQDITRHQPDPPEREESGICHHPTPVLYQAVARATKLLPDLGVVNVMNTVDFQLKPEAPRRYQIWDQTQTAPRKLTIY
jgi:hypothetical protein